jgi:hypothetical protein
MGQAWDKRVPEPFAPQTSFWKASEYRYLQAAQSVVWTRPDPFASYRPHIEKGRDVAAGPHAAFLSLRKLKLDKDERFLTAADIFASSYGLLGLFHHSYSAPILPSLKRYISPEAVIESGCLQLVDPASEGLELVAKAVNDSLPPSWGRFTKAHYGSVAMPKEVSFAPKDLSRYPEDSSGRPLSHSERESWEVARTGYDALFVFNPTCPTKSSVLVRSESIFSWQSVLLDFPPPPYDDEERWPYLVRVLNQSLVDAAPAVTFNEHSGLTQTWRCNTLLQAMYVMLWQDLIQGHKLRKCGCRDCATYYRVGPQDSKYCCRTHAERAAKRMQRGKMP